MLATVRRDIAAVRERDPAARSTAEIVLTYPGLHAIWGYRLGHRCWSRGHRLAGRAIGELTRILTGVDIHPGAVIGSGFFIDHATGVVIGETTSIGDDVTIYQGVTLGGTSLERGKRHPTVGDRVTIGAGAKVLGPVTIGDHSRIGANAVVVGVPGQVIARSRPRSSSSPPDLDDGVVPDLVGTTLAALRQRVDALEQEVNGTVTVPDIRPSEGGVWQGEDFSI